MNERKEVFEKSSKHLSEKDDSIKECGIHMDFDNRHILDYKYSTNSDGELMIYNYCGNSENLCIPATIGGSPVTQIGPYAFSDNPTIKTVVIPDGVREININAFENCTSLCSVTIPNSVTAIGESAFAGCESLPSVVISAGVEELSDQVFENCSSLSSVILPDGLESIGWNTFENCTSLTRIELPDSIIVIGNHAFAGCTALKSCNIPNNLEDMGYCVFAGCKDLVLSLVPGGFREGFAEYCQLPFVPREDTSSRTYERRPYTILRDTLYEIVANYKDCRRLAGELPDLPMTVAMERPAPWKFEDGHWCMYPGFLRTTWSFTFPENYVHANLKEALIRTFFHPEVNIKFSENSVTTLVREDISAIMKYPQLSLRGKEAILCYNPNPKYGAVTRWIAVSDSQIAIIEEFWYD